MVVYENTSLWYCGTDYRLKQLQLANGSSIISRYAYSYGDGMNLTGITDQVTAANSNALSYTPANRLASASGAWGSSSYSYDAVGNRLTDVTGSITNASLFAADSNRITGMTQNGQPLRSYSYDGAGNITQDVRAGAEVFDYTYNNRNRLASVANNGAPWGTYLYNAMEQLVSRNAGQATGGPVGTEHYVYDRDGHVIADIAALTGSTLREYIWLPANDNTSGSGNDSYAEATGLASNDNAPPDLLLAAVYNVGQANQFMHYIHSDQLGRPIRSTDATKATARNVTYKPWGEQIALPSGPSGGSILLQRAPGQYWQIETDLFYNWHRHYDYWSGRYLQPDPLGLAPGMNRYAYANNSPFFEIDPLGLRPVLNDSHFPVHAAGTPGSGHGHPDSNPSDDPYISIVIPPGGRVDHCHPALGFDSSGHPQLVYDVDAIDMNGKGYAKGSPYDTESLGGKAGNFIEWAFGDKLLGGDGSDQKSWKDRQLIIKGKSRGWLQTSNGGNIDVSSCGCPN